MLFHSNFTIASIYARRVFVSRLVICDDDASGMDQVTS